MPSQGGNYTKQRRTVYADRQPRWGFAPLSLGATSLLRLVIIGAVCLMSDGGTPRVVLPKIYYTQAGAAPHLPQRKKTIFGYRPASTYERSVLCTIGRDLTRGAAYPPDGVCRWIAFTHVGFNLTNRRLLPSTGDETTAATWATFVSRAAAFKLTRYMPSITTHSLLDVVAAHPDGPRALNKTLVALKMFGLAVLNARLTVNETWQLSRSLTTMAAANPGSFLALGLSLVGLSDRTATRLVPTELLDALVTPLSLFVLETHLPVPGAPCRTGFTTSREAYYEQRDAFTFRGARAFLTQPALKYVDSRVLGRCVSLVAGALQFNLAQNWSTPPPPGTPCRSWQVTQLRDTCRLPTIRENMEARAMWGYKDDRFFSFESETNILEKVKPLLLNLAMDDEVPTCVAVYSIETDSLRGQCPRTERIDRSLAFGLYDLLWRLPLDKK